MIKFRPNEFYLVASYFRPILELPDESDHDAFIKVIVGARCALCFFDGELIDKHLPSSKKRAIQLMTSIDDIVHHRQVMGMPNLSSLQTIIRKFETVLDEELSSAPIFCLERIGNLSTESLLEGASKGYDKAVISVLPPEALSEIDEAGKCLAFERSTASGFHILRAVEIAIRRYLMSIAGFVMPPLNRQNWGEFIKLLKENNAAKEVTDALQNIKDNYRNPLMHPMDTLELRDAISLFCVCQGMIEVLIGDLRKRGLVV